MNDLLMLAEELNKFINHDKILYLKTEPEITDFTRPFTGKLLIYGRKQRLSIDLRDKEDIINIYNQFKTTIFIEGMVLIFWNMKNLISYFRFHIPKRLPVTIEAKFVDLKPAEAFLDFKTIAPDSLNEAVSRLSSCMDNQDCKNIHNNIHKPLALRVLPDMETANCVIDVSLGKYVYPFYEIEGQPFGRLNCSKSFENCITPHNMGDDQKKKLKLKDENDFFVYFDFNHMEVSILQWLTKDMALKKASEEYEDLYKGIYYTVLGQSCDTDDKRELIKNLFLPIMFGLQPNGLVKKYDISEQFASQLHFLIRTKFKTAWDYLEDRHEQVKSTPIMKDHFGRPRFFAERPWSVRGFLVQAASAIFCQEKLIDLHDSLKDVGNLIYSIHDGYVLVAKQKNLNKLIVTGLKSLQSESKMFPGLRLKVSCSVGLRLTHLKPIPVIKEKVVNN